MANTLLNRHASTIARFLLLSLGIFLVACSDDKNLADGNLNSDSLLRESRVSVAFEGGPNAGDYEYFADASSPQSRLQLRFNPENDVWLLEGKSLQTQDGSHSIEQLRRTMKGDISTGDLSATSWLGESAFSDKACGKLVLRDEIDSKDFSAAFSDYLECGTTRIVGVGDWQKADKENGDKRWVEGEFSDRLHMQISYDADPFRKLETGVTVRFAVWQYRVEK